MSEESETKAESKDPKPAPEAVAEAKPESEAPAESKSEAKTEAEAKPEAKAADEPKTSVQQSDGDDDGAVLDATGRERPRFLLQFPEHPDLARLSAAFEAGNYALVRAEADALAERAESQAVKDAALELKRRIEPDPLAKYMLALTAALLLFLAYFAYHH